MYNENNNGFDFVTWCKDHWMATLVGTAALNKLVKIGGKMLNNYLTQRNKNLRWYDPSLGTYYVLNRELSNQEKILIDKRKRKGEKLGDIFMSLGLLK